MTLEFDETTHTYWVDGRPVPSITQIVAPLGKDYDEPDDDHLEITIEAAAERGTALHAYIAHRLNGGEAESFELPDDYAGYADAADLFLSEHNIEPLLIETPLCCGEFAGTPDLVAELDGETAIIDYKFVSALAKSKVGAQLGGYLELCVENGIEPQKLAAVQFLRDGKYRFYRAQKNAAESAFRACLELYRIKTAKHARGRIFE